MSEVFKTILIMSVFGFCVIALLLLLKPLTAKKFPAKWQYVVWIIVLICMLLPFWKIIPQRTAKVIIQTPDIQITETTEEKAEQTETIVNTGVPIEYREIKIIPLNQSIKIMDLLTLIWLSGVCVFLLIIGSSYIRFLWRKRENAITVTDNLILEKVKSELGIKKKIRIKMSPDVKSPLLSGVIFPIIYIPCANIADESLRMVFLHELTHYKRKDLLIKWVAIFVNAIHWFNPLSYMLTANIGESCEISCDMAVTKNMNETEQKIYMKTILDLV